MHFKFSFAVLLLGAFQSAVFSAPLTNSVVTRDQEFGLDARAEDSYVELFSRGNPTVLSLRRTKPGTEAEHWALHLHEPIPAGSGKDFHVKGTTHDAFNDKGAPGYKHGVTPMSTEQRDKTKTQVQHLTHIGHIPEGRHQEAIDTMNGVKCTGSPKVENCTDWTKHAVSALHDKGLLSKEDRDKFHALHAKEEEEIRKKTGKGYK